MSTSMKQSGRPSAAPFARQVHDSRSTQVVTALESRGLLHPSRRDEAVEVVDRTLAGEGSEVSSLRRRFAELAGYVGGAFVVAAAVLFLADQWVNLSVAEQVGLLMGITVVLSGAGIALGVTGGGLPALRAGTRPVRRRLGSVLFSAAAGTATAGVVVLLEDVVDLRGTGVDVDALIGLVGSLTLVILGAVGYRLAPTMLGQLVIGGGAAFAVPTGLETFSQAQAIPVGLLILALGAVWLLLAENGLWRETMAARIIGSGLVVVGAQVPVGSSDAWVGYLATVLVAAAGFAWYVGRRAWPYLAVGVVGVTLAVPEALLDWTEGSLGAAGVLLVAGLTLLGASLLGMRLRQEVAEQVAAER
jgi:hypothetical protein